MKLYSLIHIFWFMLACMIVFGSAAYAQDEPPLPAGLEEKPASTEEEPTLPMGLETVQKSEEPALPEGLGLEQPEESNTTAEREESIVPLPFDFTGFWEARVGVRTQEDKNEKDLSIGETRLQVKIDKALDYATLKWIIVTI